MATNVSILIPSYNHANYIGACIQSVLNQTLENWELIIVDDGSTDDSIQIINQFKDSRIKFHINEDNLGTYGTLDRAKSLAASPFVAVLNSDDLWEPTKLEKQIAMLQKYPTAPYCYTLGALIDGDGNILPDDHHCDLPRIELQDIFPYLIPENRIFASSVLFRRESAVFDTRLTISGDWWAAMLPAWHSPVACVPQQLTSWRVHPSGTHMRLRAVALENIRFRSAILRNTPRFLQSRFDVKLVRQKLAHCAIHLGADYVLFGKMDRARHAALLAMKFGFKRQGLKRFLATFLPHQRMLRRLWPQATDYFELKDGGSILSLNFDKFT